MRTLALACLLAILGCGGRQQSSGQVAPEQYHGCGIPSSDENPWPCGRPDGAQEADAGPVGDAGREADAAYKEPVPAIPVVPEQYHGCGFPSTAANPDPCGSSSGAGPKTLGPKPEPEQPPSNNVRDKPGYCGTPGCGLKAKPVEDKGYESEWDRPDYCGTPGCGQDAKPGPAKEEPGP